MNDVYQAVKEKQNNFDIDFLQCYSNFNQTTSKGKIDPWNFKTLVYQDECIKYN